MWPSGSVLRGQGSSGRRACRASRRPTGRRDGAQAPAQGTGDSRVAVTISGDGPAPARPNASPFCGRRDAGDAFSQDPTRKRSGLTERKAGHLSGKFTETQRVQPGYFWSSQRANVDESSWVGRLPGTFYNVRRRVQNRYGGGKEAQIFSTHPISELRHIQQNHKTIYSLKELMIRGVLSKSLGQTKPQLLYKILCIFWSKFPKSKSAYRKNCWVLYSTPNVVNNSCAKTFNITIIWNTKHVYTQKTITVNINEMQVH